MFLLCSSDFGRSLEEPRDDLQSLGYDTPVPLIRSDSYTTLLDATERQAVARRIAAAGDFWSIAQVLDLLDENEFGDRLRRCAELGWKAKYDDKPDPNWLADWNLMRCPPTHIASSTTDS